MNSLTRTLANPPQSEPIFGRDMVQNAAGGYTFKVDGTQRLRRFLILGTDGGTYYTHESKHVRENVDFLSDLCKRFPTTVLDTIVDVSDGGKALKNDYALFAYACLLRFAPDDQYERMDAYDKFSTIIRTASHLYMFFHFCDIVGKGWSAGLRRAVRNWIDEVDAEYQFTKYGNRYGYSARDVLRLAHPTPKTAEQDALFAYLVGDGGIRVTASDRLLAIGTTKNEHAPVPEVARLIRKHRLPREVVNTKHMQSPEIYSALLDDMPYGALLRNLRNLHENGVLTNRHADVMERLVSPTRRTHPLEVFKAMRALDGVNMGIHDALHTAFERSFDNIEPTGQTIAYAIDTSGSMGWSSVLGIYGFTCAEAASMMAYISAKTEDSYYTWGFDSRFYDLGISKNDSLMTALAKGRSTGGGTNAAIPFLYAAQKGIMVDTFVVVTDNETWTGSMHPSHALENYRRLVNPNARLVVVGMTATENTIGDVDDPYTLDVVGLSTDTPRLINDFAAGRI